MPRKSSNVLKTLQVPKTYFVLIELTSSGSKASPAVTDYKLPMKAFDPRERTKHFKKFGNLIYDMPEFNGLIITSTEETWLLVILENSN